MTLTYVSIVDYADGRRDVEILASRPTDTFRESLAGHIADGTATRVEIRAGYVNGGDSFTEWEARA